MRARRLHIPFEQLNEVERLIVVAKDLEQMSNQEIADALINAPEIIAERLDMPVDEVPHAPADWHRDDVDNTVAVYHSKAWLKLTLWVFGEEELTPAEFEIVWARWVSGYGPSRVAETIGPEPGCPYRVKCLRQAWTQICNGEEITCGPSNRKSVLICLGMQRPKFSRESLKDRAERRVIEIEASSARKILAAMNEAI